ncbi:MAG: ER membrane glycoprotein subunit of the GPI transamidase complex-like protein [Peltula sp. TS41687]|nr:MAG: ER membrane glycoprotein subunit of the GPI transamidase complex-like protein [Peltula sp. TS41687]
MRPLESPLLSLLLTFALWKTLLLVVALCSPGPGYDTSTALILGLPSQDTSHHASPTAQLPRIGKLVRWDAIYFVKIVERGYLFEQEWAFGSGYAKTVAVLSKGKKVIRSYAARLMDLLDLAIETFLLGSTTVDPLHLRIIVAVTLSNAAHLLSVFFLYCLTRIVFPIRAAENLAFLSASLHVFSPAAIFLSAPYGEGLFSALSFLGYILYATSLQHDERRLWLRRDALVLISGLVFGLATMVRSNGILNGALFLYDAFATLACFPHHISLRALTRLMALGVGGILVALGMIIPQWIAYKEYCQLAEKAPRPWCSRLVPSIYTWAQDNYWNVGPLRYWTVSNIPLFLLAVPVLGLLLVSSLSAILGVDLVDDREVVKQKQFAEERLPVSTTADPGYNFAERCLRRFALPQIILALLVVVVYHVQIVTRICSGYVVWYWWLGIMMTRQYKNGVAGTPWNLPRMVIRWMIVYGLVQGGLFASFLPPA